MVVVFGRPSPWRTLLQIIKPTTPLQAEPVLSHARMHSLLALEDPLLSECSGPPCIGASPIRQVKMRPHARLIHPFVRDLQAGLIGLQPTRRIASPAPSPPAAHLQTGACSGDKKISDLNRAVAVGFPRPGHGPSSSHQQLCGVPAPVSLPLATNSTTSRSDGENV